MVLAHHPGPPFGGPEYSSLPCYQELVSSPLPWPMRPEFVFGTLTRWGPLSNPATVFGCVDFGLIALPTYLPLLLMRFEYRLFWLSLPSFATLSPPPPPPTFQQHILAAWCFSPWCPGFLLRMLRCLRRYVFIASSGRHLVF